MKAEHRMPAMSSTVSIKACAPAFYKDLEGMETGIC